MELIYQMALTCALPYQSQLQRQLLEAAGSAKNLYESRHALRDMLPSAGERLAEIVAQMDKHIARAEEEREFAERKHIHIIGCDDPCYPARLRDCMDAPIVLYYRGTTDLNSRRMLAIVGTRKSTEYGHDFCKRFLADLARMCPDTIVVSGLAYGIDIQAHRQSLQNNLETIGVLAHGMDQIYPRLHRQTAIDMLGHGGLLTEFMSRSTPEKVNFVSRNRIVAGMTDATLVVESAQKGGSLITARIANEYGRNVMAVPGRIGEPSSAGCNQLIRDNRAILTQSAEDFVTDMGWVTVEQKRNHAQREMFPQLTAEERAIVAALQGDEGKQVNQISVDTNLSIAQLTGLLFDMEMRGIVQRLSGGQYRVHGF